MDPLSDLLSLLDVESCWAAGFDVGGAWSFAIGPTRGIRFYAVTAGTGWLEVAGAGEPLRLHAGDCLLMPRGLAFRVARDLAVPPVAVEAAFADAAKDGGVRRYGGGGDFSWVGGEFTVAGDRSALLLGQLPAIVHVRDEAGKAALRGSVEAMRRELSEPRPGSTIVLRHCAVLLLVQALRLHMEGAEAGGWLRALADRRLAPAIAAIHERPGAPWTVAALAACAGMSRTGFALRFKALTGIAPLAYVTRWRMAVASDRMRRSDDSLAVIAEALGYESQSAFGLAFKRVMGCSPRQHVRARPRSS